MMDAELTGRAAARLGTVLRGKYHLDRVLGMGGMAIVYAATHRNRKRFAVKVLNKELSFNEDIRNRFLREGYVANSVGHPGSVAVLDDDVADDGAAFLVMELLEGETVEELWERSRQRLPLERVLEIGHQLLDVLAAAHANGIVHRDVKPANVFLTRSGELKVLDFGIARLHDAAAARSHATHSGQLFGTPAFMAPEQAEAKASAIDARTDVWAVGAMMFTLASGRLVHESDNPIQCLIKAAHERARSLGVLLPTAPFEIIHLVDRALAFDKTARWPSADAMRDAIVAASLRLPQQARLFVARGTARRATPPTLGMKGIGIAPTLASEPDAWRGPDELGTTTRDDDEHLVTQEEMDPALVSTEPGKKEAARKATLLGLPSLVPESEEEESDKPTTLVALPTASKLVVEDESSNLSTEPGKREGTLEPPSPEWASDGASTRVFDVAASIAVLDMSHEPTTDVLRPAPRMPTMTALSHATLTKSVTETVTETRPFAARVQLIAWAASRRWLAEIRSVLRHGLEVATIRRTPLGATAIVAALIGASTVLVFFIAGSARQPSGTEVIPSVTIGEAVPVVAPLTVPSTSNVAIDETPSEQPSARATPPAAAAPPPSVVAPLRRATPSGAPSQPKTKPSAPPLDPEQRLLDQSLHPAKCNPPYTLDSSGKKLWKMECL